MNTGIENIEKIFQQITSSIVDKALLTKLAFQTKLYILQRIERAEYLEGSTGTSSYSTTPMPVPYGAFVKLMGRSLLKREGSRGAKYSKRIMTGKKEDRKFYTSGYRDEFNVYRNSNGKVMVLIHGGYKRWRELNKKNSERVIMTWSGRMLRNLGIIKTEEMKFVLGFPSQSESEKAYYAHAGAGKNKITHLFMDLTKTELDELGDLAGELIMQKLT